MRSLKLNERNADRSDRREQESEKRQQVAMSVSVLPILNLRWRLSRYSTRIELVNHGVGLAIIKEVHATGNGYAGPNFFQAFHFPVVFDWKECKVFPRIIEHYLRPGESFILLEIDKEFLLSQLDRRSWIKSDLIVDICHGIHQQMANVKLRVVFENSFREKLPDYEVDLGRIFPLQDTFEPEPPGQPICSG